MRILKIIDFQAVKEEYLYYYSRDIIFEDSLAYLLHSNHNLTNLYNKELYYVMLCLTYMICYCYLRL